MYVTRKLQAVRFDLFKHSVLQTNSFILTSRPIERGEVFLGPTMFGGPPSLKILKRVFQMASFLPEMCIKSIFGWGCAPDPAVETYDTPPDP